MTNEKAGFWPRVAAHLVDWIILTLTFFIFQRMAYARRDYSFQLEPSALMADLLTALFLLFFYTLLFFAYFTYFHGAMGQTIGKMLFGLKVVSTDGQPISYGISLVRTVAYQASWSSLGLGFLWAAFERHHQAWHDKIAGTKVIKIRQAKGTPDVFP